MASGIYDTLLQATGRLLSQGPSGLFPPHTEWPVAGTPCASVHQHGRATHAG